jgi:hypothetical protein
VRDPFPGNRVPADRINPVARRLLDFIPLPNLPETRYGLANYASPARTTSDYNQWLGRMDYRINDRNTVYFSGGMLPYVERDEVLFPNSPADVSRENPLFRDFYRYVADWSSTLGPQTLLNVRAGYVRFAEQLGNPLALGFDPRQLGMSPELVSQFRVIQFPRFEIGGFYTNIGSDRPFQANARDTQSYQVSLNRTQGRHQIKVGTEFRVYNENSLNSGYSSGRYRFSRMFTQAEPLQGDNVSGDEFAAFLLGVPSEGQVDLAIDPAFQSRYYTIFLQDDVRLSTRLTINFGLRYDYETPYRERYDRMVRGFAFDQASPLADRVSGVRGGLLYAGSESEMRYASNPDRNNIQPRIGAAFQISERWVLRGGYGLYYMGLSGGQPTTGFSATTPLVPSADAGLTPRVNLTNGFPGPLIPPVGSSLGLATNLGQNVDFGYLNRVAPYSQQFTFSIQHVLPWGMVAEATYSGNGTRRYPVETELNTIPMSELGQPLAYYTEQVPNPLQGLLPLNPARNRATVPRQDLLVPFPQFGSVTMRNIPLGTNSYHALQTRLVMRPRAGMTLNLGYVWSKTLEERSFLNPQDFNLNNIDDSKLERRLAEFDVPHRLTALWTAELPFGRGRAIGSNVRGVWDKLISGWQINAIGTLQSGFPIPFPNAPNLEPRSARLSNDGRTIFTAFDRSLFPRTAPNLRYTYRTWPTRFPDVRTYPLRNLDLGLAKKTTITERLRFELRAEAYNVTNTPWFNNTNSRATDVSAAEFGWFNLSSATNRGVTLIGKFIW